MKGDPPKKKPSKKEKVAKTGRREGVEKASSLRTEGQELEEGVEDLTVPP